eukprot:6621818-Pyramimonas_sp.AAC.2
MLAALTGSTEAVEEKVAPEEPLADLDLRTSRPRARNTSNSSAFLMADSAPSCATLPSSLWMGPSWIACRSCLWSWRGCAWPACSA